LPNTKSALKMGNSLSDQKIFCNGEKIASFSHTTLKNPLDGLSIISLLP